MNARLMSCLVLVTFTFLISSCNQSDGTTKKRETPKHDASGINAQVVEALKIVQSNQRRSVPKAPDGPVPKTEAEFVNLSLQHYLDGEWEKCVDASVEALNINPSSALAYNNICSAYIQLKDFDRAILACHKALALKPDFPRAQANLNAAISLKEGN